VAAEQTNATVSCPAGQIISKIVTASYGDPLSGSCGSYTITSTTCRSGLSDYFVGQACLGQQTCTVGANNNVFGNDPCDGEVKTLTIDAQCAPAGTSVTLPTQPVAPALSSSVSNPPAGDVHAGAKQRDSDVPDRAGDFEYPFCELRLAGRKLRLVLDRLVQRG
jgi:hypothetical protein